ncbi:sulfite exporter TauE/SafE family protein [Lacrimispora sp.]|uniref:sulfite exporter TauE/SafE family protein n=1 Tax=Lacrimispora sp. TaxID=2719234 RepID=UPI003460FEE4
MNILFFTVSFLASIIGTICGIGGGVIIKPTMDMLGLASISTISFLSGCTVLAMSSYNVIMSFLTGENQAELKTGTFLAVGAVIGGIVGKQSFTITKGMFLDPDIVGAVQAGFLTVLTLSTLIYTLKKQKIKTLQVKSEGICIIIGLLLGFFSAFIGIGGGPVNLAVLYYFFSMDIKRAAQSSLYIILFSQISSIGITLWTNTVPEFTFFQLVIMIVGGLTGAMSGRFLNKRMKERTVDQLFRGIMAIIILIGLYNVYQYSLIS